MYKEEEPRMGSNSSDVKTPQTGQKFDIRTTRAPI